MIRKFKILISGMIFFLVTFCTRVPDALKDKDLQAINPAKLEHLKNLKIFFGHQSVGYNIVDGLNLIGNQDARLKLNVVETNSQIGKDGIFAHAACGRNENPQSKMQAFDEILNSSAGKQLDLALLKFCYIDVFENTDVAELFNQYISTVDSIKKRLPNLKIIHVTIPLRVHENKKNVLRHKYNEMLREKYKGIDPVFDIAKIESQTPEGQTVTFQVEGGTYPKLYKKYASDAGHLNKLGQWYAAKELLLTLVNSQEM